MEDLFHIYSDGGTDTPKHIYQVFVAWVAILALGFLPAGLLGVGFAHGRLEFRPLWVFLATYSAAVIGGALIVTLYSLLKEERIMPSLARTENPLLHRGLLIGLWTAPLVIFVLSRTTSGARIGRGSILLYCASAITTALFFVCVSYDDDQSGEGDKDRLGERYERSPSTSVRVAPLLRRWLRHTAAGMPLGMIFLGLMRGSLEFRPLGESVLFAGVGVISGASLITLVEWWKTWRKRKRSAL